MNNFGEKVSFLWSVADLIRDAFKRSKYQDVILPLTVLRRIDCVLAPTKEQVLTTHQRFKDKLDNLSPLLSKASGLSFYNTSPFDFERLLADSAGLKDNLIAYLNGFSDNMREVLEKFDFRNTINKLDEAGLLFQVMERFKAIDLHPDKVSNMEMGYIFEELIRKFNEALNENPGEHFTPREVIRLMVNLLLAFDLDALKRNHIIRKVYDPCCGSGGMLTTAKERILEINPNAEVYLYGQEVNPETFAMCKSDFYLKSPDGKDAEHIVFGSTLSNDRHEHDGFDYLLTNPPYGKDWKRDQEAVEAEAEKGDKGRFGAGTPRISDGQLLFLQHMLGRMQPIESGGSRVAIVMNGSPLFTGDAGGGETEIRRWILEKDYLEAIVGLPEQLFYNTGIATYVWVLTNRKEPRLKGQVQLIDATSYWQPMKKSLGNKRREISKGHIDHITELHLRFEEGEHSKIFDIADFGYRKVRVDRPLKLNFCVNEERIGTLRLNSTFVSLAVNKSKNQQERGKKEVEGRKLQEAIVSMLKGMSDTVYKDRAVFDKVLNAAIRKAGLSLTPTLKKAVLMSLSERDETAEICRDKQGNPEADPDLRDYEHVPLKEDIHDYFEREVVPHVPDAWIDMEYRDSRDARVGKKGYEINFNRYFYKFQPPRPLEEIEADIKKVEGEILELLREVAG